MDQRKWKNPEQIVFIPKSRSLILIPGDSTAKTIRKDTVCAKFDMESL